jgi:hypothetical protein
MISRRSGGEDLDRVGCEPDILRGKFCDLPGEEIRFLFPSLCFDDLEGPGIVAFLDRKVLQSLLPCVLYREGEVEARPFRDFLRLWNSANEER